MPTVAEITKVKFEIEELKRKVANAEGDLQRLRQMSGHTGTTAELRKKLTELGKQTQQKQEEVRKKLESYRQKHQQLFTKE